MKKVISNLKNFFLSMDIWGQPGLDKFYLGIVTIYYNPKTENKKLLRWSVVIFLIPTLGYA
jgi:hypothetical protein